MKACVWWGLWGARAWVPGGSLRSCAHPIDGPELWIREVVVTGTLPLPSRSSQLEVTLRRW